MIEIILNKNRARVVCFLLVFLTSFQLHAKELNFITLEVAPWASVDAESGELIGMFPDIVREMQKRTGIKINMTLTPYARVNRELEPGRQDCTILISEEKRSMITTRGELVFDHPMGVIAHKSIRLDSYVDLSVLTISLLRGSTVSKQFDNDSSLKKAFDTDYDIALGKIKHGRLEAIAGAIPTIQYLAKQKGMGDLLGKPLQLNVEPIYLQCSNKSKHLDMMPKLNQVILDMHKDDTIKSIVNKFTL